MKTKHTVLSILFIFSFGSFFAQDQDPPIQYPFGEPGSSPRGIFGEDNRKEIKDAEGFEDFARATAVMVPKHVVKGNRIYSYSLRELLSQQFGTTTFDDNVKFLDQPAAANCSGFLVAPDILISAGHCIQTMEEARKWVWLFDYTNTLAYNEDEHYFEIDPNNIYSITAVIDAKLEEDVTEDNSQDYTILKLDRKSKRRPYRFRTSGVVAKGTKMFTIGAPTGLPLKLSTNATVVANDATSWFKSDIDAFPGSSGGPVFDENGFIEGILVRGAVEYSNGIYTGDYKYDSACDCVKTVTFEKVGYSAGCQAHKIGNLPKEILKRIVYDNMAYAVENHDENRFNDWTSYHWILTDPYTIERGRIEDVAVQAKNYTLLKRLLFSFHDTYPDAYARSLLDKAINQTNLTLLDAVLDYYIHPDAGYDRPLKAIQQAVKENKTAMVKLLLKYDAEVALTDTEGNTLLHDAARNGNQELVMLFIKQGVRPDIKNNDGQYAEKIAKNNGYTSLANALKEARKG